MRTIEINIYKMNELSEDIQDKIVRDFYADNPLPYGDEILASMKAIAKHLGVKITDYQLSDYQDSYVKHTVHGAQVYTIHRTYRYIVNNFSDILKQNKVYEKNGKKRVSKIIKEDSCCPLTGFYYDEIFLDVIREYLKKPDHRIVEDIIHTTLNCATKIYYDGCKNYFSKENVFAMSEANNWEYTGDGEFFTGK